MAYAHLMMSARDYEYLLVMNLMFDILARNWLGLFLLEKI